MSKKSMLHKSIKLLGTGGLLVSALLQGQTAFAQSIVGSKHDLSSGGSNTTIRSTTTAETCVFCHTPHGASTAVQLWNRNTPVAAYTYYTSTTMQGATATAASIAFQSAMCLSCHDGTTALNNLINNPGSGTGTAPTMGAATMAGVGMANLGVDLRNDHPVGVPYCGGAGGSATAPNGCMDKDFKLTYLVKTGVSQAAVAFAAGLVTDSWWLDVPGVGTALTKDKTDLPLYVAAGYLVPTVQCATCHEPHNANGAGSMVSFLRTPNTASIICTTCHAK